MLSYAASWFWEKEEIHIADPRQTHLKHLCLKQIRESHIRLSTPLKSVTWDSKVKTKKNKKGNKYARKRDRDHHYLFDLEGSDAII